MGLDLLGFGYAAVVAGGGVFGYVKAGSIMSLGMGLMFGSIISYGAYNASSNPPTYSVALGASAILGSAMGYRFYSTGKFMPAGIVALLSIAMAVRYAGKVSGLLEDKQTK